jgi:hypothetical protein
VGVSKRQATRKAENAIMKRLALLALLSLFPNLAQAHNYWANGEKVPDWVKGACCGPADVHKLTMSNVHTAPWNEDYLIVDGYNEPIRKATALPSEDGFVWIFYKDDVNTPGGQSRVYCLFVPMDE